MTSTTLAMGRRPPMQPMGSPRQGSFSGIYVVPAPKHSSFMKHGNKKEGAAGGDKQ